MDDAVARFRAAADRENRGRRHVRRRYSKGLQAGIRPTNTVLKANVGPTTLLRQANQARGRAPKVWAQPVGVSWSMCRWGWVARRSSTSFRYWNGGTSTSLQL